MKVKDLIKKLNSFDPNMDIYTNDQNESGGCLEFNSDPELTKLVVLKSQVEPYEGETYIDEKKYHPSNDPDIVKEFEAVLMEI